MSLKDKVMRNLEPFRYSVNCSKCGKIIDADENTLRFLQTEIRKKIWLDVLAAKKELKKRTNNLDFKHMGKVYNNDMIEDVVNKEIDEVFGE